MNNDKYVLDGRKVIVCNNLLEWACKFEDMNRVVAKTHIPSNGFLVWLGKLFKSKRFEPVKVSTVFLGLDHSYGEGPLRLFETMIFGGKFDEEVWRYATWNEAEKGHKAAVEKVITT